MIGIKLKFLKLKGPNHNKRKFNKDILLSLLLFTIVFDNSANECTVKLGHSSPSLHDEDDQPLEAAIARLVP